MVRFAGRRALNKAGRKIVVARYQADGEPNRLDQRRGGAVADQLKKAGVPSLMVLPFTVADLPPSSPTALISTCSGVYD